MVAVNTISIGATKLYLIHFGGGMHTCVKNSEFSKAIRYFILKNTTTFRSIVFKTKNRKGKLKELINNN